MSDPVIRLPEPAGDSACWLGRVCPECGALDESAAPSGTCWRCGAERDEA